MNWIELRALHQLNATGEIPVNQTLANSSTIRFLTDSLVVLDRTSKKIVALEGYAALYHAKYAALYNRYQAFLVNHDLLKPQTRFELADIEVLIKVAEGMESGDLHGLRQQIIATDESLKGVSNMFFKNEKYLLDRPSLVNALKQILQVEEFSVEKDQQYMYKLECHNPSVIVLCENLDFLTKPNKPRQLGIELWYAGGKNVQKLQYATTRGLPIYYSCDWDHDGLSIFALVRRYYPDIVLLTPNGTPRSIEETEHNSLWRNRQQPQFLSGLDACQFGEHQQQLIKTLINENSWIIEESNDLVTMLEQVGLTLADRKALDSDLVSEKY